MRSWQVALSTIGFVRIYIEKLRHIRCLAFVKVNKKFDQVCSNEVESLCRKTGINLAEMKDMSKLMFIPQDSTSKKVLEKENDKIEDKNLNLSKEFLQEFCDLEFDIGPVWKFSKRKY